MSRSIELGRAVFAIQSTNLELWLTTLITLSPDTINHSEQRNSIDLYSFESTGLLESIATGNAWVERGNSMHMTLNFRKFGRPLDSHSLLQLGESLVHGPAWGQFGHCPRLPVNYQPTDGSLRINIDQRCEDKDPLGTADSTARLFSAHVRPPQGILTLCLDSIDLTVAIFEIKNRAVVRKRQKREVTCQMTKLNATEPSLGHNHSFSEEECVLGSGPSRAPENDQPKVVSNTQCSPITSDVESIEKSGKRNRAVTVSSISMLRIADYMSSEPTQLANLTDAVLRFSVSLTTKGSVSVSKPKASTFIYGLADIAPALWRTGYLSTFSHALYSNPIIGRSLERISVSARSPTLKAKTRALLKHPSEYDLGHDLIGHEPTQNTNSAMTDRLWIYVQRSQISKAMVGSIRAFCSPGSNITPVEEPSEILEEREAQGGSTGQLIGTRPEPTPNVLSNRHCSALFNNYIQSSLKSGVAHDIVESPVLINAVNHSQHSVALMPTSHGGRSGAFKEMNSNSMTGEEGMLFNSEETFQSIGVITDQRHNHTNSDVKCASEAPSLLMDDELLLFNL